MCACVLVWLVPHLPCVSTHTFWKHTQAGWLGAGRSPAKSCHVPPLFCASTSASCCPASVVSPGTGPLPSCRMAEDWSSDTFLWATARMLAVTHRPQLYLTETRVVSFCFQHSWKPCVDVSCMYMFAAVCCCCWHRGTCLDSLLSSLLPPALVL